MKKIRILAKQGTAIFMAILLLALAGCGARTEGDMSDQKKDNGKENIKANESAAKGRYMESDLSLLENLDNILALETLEDGSIVLLDEDKGAFVSKDGGKTFEQKDTFLHDHIGKDTYIYHGAIGKDGSYFAMYYTNTGDVDNEKNFKLIFVDKDGNVTDINADLKNNGFVECLAILSDGSLVISDGEYKVYRVDKETGALEEICEADSFISHIQQIGNILYIVESTIKQYDLTTNSFLEDLVLDDFAKEKLRNESGSYAEGESKILLCEGDEENTIYIACSDGLYRHVVGGNIMEEVMKGNLTSLGDPALSLQHMIRKENGEFLILYFNYSASNPVLMNYAYDSEAAAVPEKMLKIYSLTDDNSIKQAISEYQKKHSDVYVQYEVGLTEKSGMTREDAIRNLNTELLSGDGPDLLLLDGIPIDSYINKGILADLSEMISEKFAQDEFFENILNTYQRDGKLYAIPSRFKIPIIYGEKSIIDGITDLTSLADAVEKLREQKASGTIMEIYSEKETINKLYDVNSPVFMEKDGTINKEKLTAFLVDAKRIYQAEQQGISEEERKIHEGAKQYVGEDYYLNASSAALEYLEGSVQIGSGRTSCVTTAYMDYSTITSALNKKGGEQSIKLMPGQGGNVFIPCTVLGVCENGGEKELAMDFAFELLSQDLQIMSLETGYPVNKKAFTDSLTNPNENEGDQDSGLSMSWSREMEDGSITMNSLEMKWIDEEEKKHLEEMAASLDTPSATDEMMKQAILESAPAALNGEKTVEDVVNEIIDKVQIYLAE